MEDSTGVIDQGTQTGEATGQATADGSVTEKVASEGTQGQEANAGGEKSFSESGKDNGTGQRRGFKSPQQRLYELNNRYRERESYWEKEVGTIKEQLARYEKMFGQGQERRPSRTFYEAPEDTLREILAEQQKTLKDELLSEFRQTQEERESAMSLKQEASEAAKFIRSQKGITDDDIQEIREILVSDKVAQSLADQPMEQANYVMYLFSKQRGVTDKSALKDKARGVSGASVSSGGASKTWTEPEMAAEMAKLGPVEKWGPEQKAKRQSLESEFMRAYADGRVKK